jgi:hypothetical protein
MRDYLKYWILVDHQPVEVDWGRYLASRDGYDAASYDEQVGQVTKRRLGIVS